MALYVIVTEASRQGNVVSVSANLMEDSSNPDTLLSTFDHSFSFRKDGTNPEKRQDIQNQLIHWAMGIIQDRQDADANAATVVSQLIGSRWPPA